MYEENRAYLSTRQLPKFEVDLSAWPKAQGIVDELAKNKEADKALVFNALAGCVSVAVSASNDVEMVNGVVIPTSLYLITVADSGEKKSAVFNTLKKVIYDFEKTL